MDPPPAPPTTTAVSTTTPKNTLPRLEILPPSTPHTFIAPTKRINEGPDVELFLTSKAYRDICTFILQLNRALCPRKDPATGTVKTFTLLSPRDDPPAVKSLRELLSKVESIIDEAPPNPGPRRFGNVSFRTWHSLLEERAGGLLKEFLPVSVVDYSHETQVTALTELKEYFLGAFGSSSRLDYGTGHELSFVAFLGCLWKLGAFFEGDGDDDANRREPGDLERSIALGVIEPYLAVIRKLILTYTLEPAGSHGVWGLDDHSFIPYILGSAQLTRPLTLPSSSPEHSSADSAEPTPLEGSCPNAPKPSSIVKPTQVETYRSQNMYFSAIGFINDVKKGPFWEHSPILFDISGIKDGWGKINKGMIKMFNAEVLGKFPVVQHFVFGSLFSWERDPDAPAVVERTVHMVNQPQNIATTAGGGGGAGTAVGPGMGMGARMGGGGTMGMPMTGAPWAASASRPGPPVGGGAGTAAPWKTPSRTVGGLAESARAMGGPEGRR